MNRSSTSFVFLDIVRRSYLGQIGHKTAAYVKNAPHRTQHAAALRGDKCECVNGPLATPRAYAVGRRSGETSVFDPAKKRTPLTYVLSTNLRKTPDAQETQRETCVSILKRSKTSNPCYATELWFHGFEVSINRYKLEMFINMYIVYRVFLWICTIRYLCCYKYGRTASVCITRVTVTLWKSISFLIIIIWQERKHWQWKTSFKVPNNNDN